MVLTGLFLYGYGATWLLKFKKGFWFLIRILGKSVLRESVNIFERQTKGGGLKIDILFY